MYTLGLLNDARRTDLLREAEARRQHKHLLREARAFVEARAGRQPSVGLATPDTMQPTPVSPSATRLAASGAAEG